MDEAQKIENVNDIKDKATLAEFALYDVFDRIFAKLSLKDLNRAMAVCKSWKYMADKEISRRNDIQTWVLKMVYDSDDYSDDEDKDYDTFKYLQDRWHISDSLRSLPHMVLLFCDYTGPTNGGGDDIFLHYGGRFHNHTRVTVFQTFAVSMDSTELYGKTNLGIGIMIPSTPSLKVDYYAPYDTDFMKHGDNNTLSHFANEVVNELLTTEEEHNCFIYFSRYSDASEEIDVIYLRSFFSEFAKVLKSTCKLSTYSLWGGEISETVTNICNFGRNDLIDFVALRLSGPALKSWSIVLKLNLPDTEAENVLLNFKEGIQLKSHSFALAMAPTTKHEPSKQRLAKTEIFRKVFPKIPLIGIYEKNDFFQFGFNSTSCDIDSVLQHTNSVAYLIVTTK